MSIQPAASSDTDSRGAAPSISARVGLVLVLVALTGGLLAIGAPAEGAVRLKVVRAYTNVCLRAYATPGGASFGCLPRGARVSVKCWVKGTRVTAVYKGRSVTSRRWARTTTGRYISEAYLTARAHPHRKCARPAPKPPPTPAPPPAPPAPAPPPPGTRVNPAACPAKPTVFNEIRMQPAAIAVGRCAAARWPQVTWIGGWRKADAYPDHPSGQAVDIMLPGLCSADPAKRALADQIADHFMRNAAAYGVVYIISQQRVWANGRDAVAAPSTWRAMSNRGSCSANHYDHVHVTTIGPVAVG